MTFLRWWREGYLRWWVAVLQTLDWHVIHHLSRPFCRWLIDRMSVDIRRAYLASPEWEREIAIGVARGDHEIERGDYITREQFLREVREGP